MKQNGPHKASISEKEEARLRRAIRSYVKEKASTHGLHPAMMTRFRINDKLLRRILEEETKQ